MTDMAMSMQHYQNVRDQEACTSICVVAQDYACGRITQEEFLSAIEFFQDKRKFRFEEFKAWVHERLRVLA